MSCKYCRNEIDLINERDTRMFIDNDDKLIVFEHTEFRCEYNDPYSGEEDVLYKDLGIKFCPMCGGEL